jgi:hypothetical protein
MCRVSLGKNSHLTRGEGSTALRGDQVQRLFVRPRDEEGRRNATIVPNR